MRDPLPAVAGAAATLVLAVVAMVATRDFVRRSISGAAGFRAPRWIAPQWGPIAIFAVLLVAAIVLVGWMIAVFAKSGVKSRPAAEVRTEVSV